MCSVDYDLGGQVNESDFARLRGPNGSQYFRASLLVEIRLQDRVRVSIKFAGAEVGSGEFPRP